MALLRGEIDQFVEHGYTFVRGAISEELIDQLWRPREEFLNSVEEFDGESHLYFPVVERRWDVKQVSPALDEAILQIVGGEERSSEPRKWGDGFVVARPLSDIQPNRSHSVLEDYRWHKDGFHRHFLDSPEIGVIVLIMWTDLTEENGATALAEKSIEVVSKKLLDHPEGLDGDFFDKNQILDSDNVHEIRAIGDAGDVCLIHPMLLHALRPNLSSSLRAITNPIVRLNRPLKFNRQNGRYSPVERAVLNALGVRSLDFRATGERGKTFSTEKAGKFDIMRSILRSKIYEYEAAKATRLENL